MIPELITTHRLTRDNVELLHRVADEVFDADIDALRLETYLDSPGHLMILAVCELQVVGQVAGYIHKHPDQAADIYIDNLGVAPRFQRRGIASGLVGEILTWGRDLGCQQAWVVTDIDNKAARALYEKRGATAEPIVMYSYQL